MELLEKVTAVGNKIEAVEKRQQVQTEMFDSYIICVKHDEKAEQFLVNH